MYNCRLDLIKSLHAVRLRKKSVVLRCLLEKVESLAGACLGHLYKYVVTTNGELELL